MVTDAIGSAAARIAQFDRHAQNWGWYPLITK
jgi:hypothetical protein